MALTEVGAFILSRFQEVIKIYFDSGKLNKRITFISYLETKNEIGQLIQQPVPIKTVWAFLEPIRGHQQTEAQRLSNETTYKILTRYHKGINQEMLINYEGTHMTFIEMFQSFGFPVACVAALGVYIAKVQNESRADSKEREDKLFTQLGELSATNKMLLETNAVLARDINTKLDQIVANIKG